jgi:hypothetical protein
MQLEAALQDKDTVIRRPHDATVTRENGRKVVDERDPRHSVEMQEEGAAITLFFDPDGHALVEVRLTPAAGGAFEPWRLIPHLPLHVQYARARLAYREGDAIAALLSLRETVSTRRGLNDDFLRAVALSYVALIREGERYPAKAIAEYARADKSTVSRWLSAARTRGLMKEA